MNAAGTSVYDLTTSERTLEAASKRLPARLLPRRSALGGFILLLLFAISACQEGPAENQPASKQDTGRSATSEESVSEPEVDLPEGLLQVTYSVDGDGEPVAPAIWSFRWTGNEVRVDTYCYDNPFGFGAIGAIAANRLTLAWQDAGRAVTAEGDAQGEGYAGLWSDDAGRSGRWRTDPYQGSEPPVCIQLLSPAPGSEVSANGLLFEWTSYAPAEKYAIRVGKIGGLMVWQMGNIRETSVYFDQDGSALAPLEPGATYYVHIYGQLLDQPAMPETDQSDFVSEMRDQQFTIAP